MTAHIVLIRHAETEANAADVWQGRSDAALTDRGRRQVEALARRLDGQRFDLVVSSDLGRAVTTASALAGTSPELDGAWREMDIGRWEGKSDADVARDFAAERAALRRGEDLPVGGGERFTEFSERVGAAYEALTGRLADGDRVLVVTHGGVIYALLARVLGVDVRGKALRVNNTAVSAVTHTSWGPQLAVYNDVTHLPDEDLRVRGEATHLFLLRHGETVANVEQRWQGHSPGELTENGRLQADRLAAVLPEVDALYSSPLARAHDTAAELSRGRGLDLRTRDDLKEIGFGEWEMLTPEEIHALDPEAMTRIRNGEDVVRGGTGETFRGVQARMRRALEDIATAHPGGRIAVVSHGGALRAFVTDILGVDFPARYRLGILRNTAMARVVRTGSGFALGAWNLAPHLER